jgi:hydroxymethylbilane synthase
MGGCSTPISALAVVQNGTVVLRGNICSTDGRQLEEIKRERPVAEAASMGLAVANELLQTSAAQKIMADIRHAKN